MEVKLIIKLVRISGHLAGRLLALGRRWKGEPELDSLRTGKNKNNFEIRFIFILWRESETCERTSANVGRRTSRRRTADKLRSG